MVEIIMRLSGKRFRGRYTDINGKRVSKTFKKEKLAKVFEDDGKAQVEKNRALGTKLKSSITFGEYSERFIARLKYKGLSRGTIESYKAMMANHLLPLLQAATLKDIGKDVAESLIEALIDKGHNERGANKILSFLKTVLSGAVQDQYLSFNPLNGMKGLKVTKKSYQYWSESEISMFLAKTIDHDLYDLFLVALNTGLRQGELCGLRWKNIDLERKKIHIDQAMTPKGLSRLKSNKILDIPMNDLVFRTLKNRKWQFEQCSEFVFLWNGKTVPNNTCWRQFKSAQKKAGVRQIKFHDLRHTFASHYLMNGGDIFVLQQLLGHSKIEMTQIYSHLSQKHLENAVSLFSLGGRN